MRCAPIFVAAIFCLLYAETRPEPDSVPGRTDTTIPADIAGSFVGSGDGIDTANSCITANDIYCYPNPFVRGWGHSVITFTGLFGRTRIRVFDMSGFPLLDDEVAATNGSYTWGARTRYGHDLPVGFYFYLVTLESGKAGSGVLVIAQ
jgi:hypothetical protein